MKRNKNIVSKAMRSVKSVNTSPEIIFREIIWSKGFRYRKNCKDIVGKPDIANKKYKIAIFIDGDYWHGNQYKLRGYSSLEEQLSSVNNKEYWIKKINNNIKRDAENTEKLRANGWIVIRFWESQIKKEPYNCIEKALSIIKKRKESYENY